MTYSCSDFTDDVYAELVRVGAINEQEDNHPDLNDNASLQADFALRAIARLVEAKDAFAQYRGAVENLAERKGVSLQDKAFRKADDRARKALSAIQSKEPDEAL